MDMEDVELKGAIRGFRDPRPHILSLAAEDIT